MSAAIPGVACDVDNGIAASDMVSLANDWTTAPAEKMAIASTSSELFWCNFAGGISPTKKSSEMSPNNKPNGLRERSTNEIDRLTIHISCLAGFCSLGG